MQVFLNTIVGTATGAASDVNVPGGIGGSALLGFGTSYVGAIASDGITQGRVTGSDWAWAALDGGLGAGENAAGTAVTEGAPEGSPAPENEEVGNVGGRHASHLHG